eukprot:XP_014775733.1 PREDICTED: UPF0746 protein DDB_G0281095-like isoform X2 [Octopus bimaculoides]
MPSVSTRFVKYHLSVNPDYSAQTMSGIIEVKPQTYNHRLLQPPPKQNTEHYPFQQRNRQPFNEDDKQQQQQTHTATLEQIQQEKNKLEQEPPLLPLNPFYMYQQQKQNELLQCTLYEQEQQKQKQSYLPQQPPQKQLQLQKQPQSQSQKQKHFRLQQQQQKDTYRGGTELDSCGIQLLDVNELQSQSSCL